MEKAILKTLIYSNIFDYPLKAYEVHKWLIGKQATFQQVEKALERLRNKDRVERGKDFFYLQKRSGLIKKRINKEKQSKKYFFKAKVCSQILRIIPTLKLMGISGGLSLNNAQKGDDIDLFLITEKGTIWVTRLMVILILDLLGVRRKVKMKKSKVGGKVCVNILLEEDKLEQQKKDLYIAHEVLQMKVLWQRENTYKKYLEDNEWVFKYLPNWTTGQNVQSKIYNIKKNSTFYTPHSIFYWLENATKKFQLWYMQKPKGLERIQDGALYFHPHDVREKVLKEFKEKTKNL